MPTRPPSRSRRRWPLWLGLGILAGVALVMLPPFVRVPEQADLALPEDLADEDSKFAEIDGIRFHYKDQGNLASPHTIVFLHGFASSLYSWRHAMAGLRDRYRVIAFDRDPDASEADGS